MKIATLLTLAAVTASLFRSTSRHRLSAAVAEAVKSLDIVKRLEDQNTDPVGNTPAQMAEVIRQDTERWVGVVRAANVKVD